MRNITVAVSDEVYRQARIRAAERDTSVSALVNDFLRSLGGDEEFDRRERLQDDVLRRIEGFSAADRLDRDELHDRALR